MASGPDDDGEPVFITVAVHDVVTPLISAFGLVTGLYDRLRTGRGQRVRTSLAQTAMAAQAAEHTRYAGSTPAAAGRLRLPRPGRRPGLRGGRRKTGTAGGSSRASQRTPIVRTGLINQAIAADNGLCVTDRPPPVRRRSPSSASWWWAPAHRPAGARCSTSTGAEILGEAGPAGRGPGDR